MLKALLTAQTGLSTDEAHYALYAYFPDWSYFDHPPLVGWLQIPWVWLLSFSPASPLLGWVSSEFFLRSLPLSLHLIGLLGAYRLGLLWLPKTTSFSKAQFAFWLVLLDQSVVMWQLLTFALLPDSLLLTLVPWLMLDTWRLLQPAPNLGHWLKLGLLLGISALSKYTAIFWLFPIVGLLLLHYRWRIFAQQGLYAAVFVALLLITPILLWNAQHNWISLLYQIDHGSGGEWRWLRFFQAIGAQAIVYGPLLFFSLIAQIYLLLKNTRSGPAAVFDETLTGIRFSLAFALPFLLITYFLSGRSTSLPHWTAAPWFTLLPITAFLLSLWYRQTPRKNLPRFALVAVFLTQYALCTLVFGLTYLGGIRSEKTEELNTPAITSTLPFADVYGWQQAAEQAVRLAHRYQAQHLMVMDWTQASRMAWYARPMNILLADRGNTQFALWYQPFKAGDKVLAINWSQQPEEVSPKNPQLSFLISCQKLADQNEGRLIVTRFGKILSHFDFYLCHSQP